MSSLPEEMVMLILPKLPVKSISRFRCVCKSWYELFKNPKFIKTHHHHATENNKFSVLLESVDDGCYYTIDFDVTSSSYGMLVETERPCGSYISLFHRVDLCGGIIGLRHYQYEIVLWNPLTGEYKTVSFPKSISNRHIRCGFCYDWRIDDYKVFEIVSNHPYDRYSCQVWVSTLGSDSWENIGNIHYSVFNVDNIHYSGFNVDRTLTQLNGIIHWIGNSKVISSFDIVEGKTKEIQIPSCYLDDGLYSCKNMEVGVLGEDLYLLFNGTRCQGNIDLWVMKDYGVTDSWTKVFSLSEDKTSFISLRPLHYLNKNREILLCGRPRSEVKASGKNVLVAYDPKSGRLVTLDIPCMPKLFTATAFVGSLVSLNSGEFVMTTKIAKMDTSPGASKFFPLKVEQAKYGYLESGRYGRGTYFVFLLVLLGSYLALVMLGS